MNAVDVRSNVDAYDFDLPDELIALRPAEPRISARLLVVDGRDGTFVDARVSDLPDFLRPRDVLVVNSSRVIRAALSGVRAARDEMGANVNLTVNLNRRIDSGRWSVFLRPAKRVRLGDEISFAGGLKGRIAGPLEGGECELAFNREGDSLDAAIQAVGSMPLPPYILSKREADRRDASDYQTTFAEAGESVAAPTAGLHFTPMLLDQVRERGVGLARVRLDVNAGTFRPMTSESLEGHKLHAERIFVDEEAVRGVTEARSAGGRCIAVGTTSMRSLESAGRGGVLDAYEGETDIFLKPGDAFHVCDGLLTNFHLPRSTLFVLVSAFMGLDLMQKVYRHAIDQRYRFYSYGDACLLLPDG